MLTGSRASSILSTSTGDGSVQTPSSPTLRAKDALSTNARIPAPPPPPPLPQVMFHNHSRKAPIRPTLTLQTQLQRTIARAPSFQPNKTPASQQLSSPVSGPSNSLPSSPAPVQSPNVLRREPSSNSPVTRSHCRYHKISLLEEDDGGHIYFLVPGCSLVDRKLIKEEEIKDHGDATYEDSTRKVADIETLGINDYVISVIRMLVGPDKEHEVYFLPKPGEERARRVTATHHRSNLSRSSITASNSSNVFASPRTSHANNNAFSPSSSSMAAPVSAAGSSSTNRSQRSRRQPQDREAESSLWSEAETSTDTDGEDSDGDYDGPPESKKQKLAHLSEGGRTAEPGLTPEPKSGP
ncbi:hypothetical protein BT96DRAFT_18449 [Gymnopus androsaceus JB14]|uniref:Uncharacterized protein n=1 Tax=Gymnopus androsaceus JB14 TaxID=1447944 RepID=A0A6A4IPI0_9AGAR|nr:hypothetical protein BT96DRAFT_18449 [Gymnopus androsaceus JB14]